jgi:hypothetical protein
MGSRGILVMRRYNDGDWGGHGVRLAFATDRTQALDLPNPLSKPCRSELTRVGPRAPARRWPELRGYYTPFTRQNFLNR